MKSGLPLWLSLVFAGLVFAAPAKADPIQAPQAAPRDSQLEVDADDAWELFGFRLELAAGYGFSGGGELSPDMQAITLAVGAGWRFNRWWGVMTHLRYGVLLQGFNGLRWSASVEPVFFITTGLGVSAGVGYGGLLGDRAVRGPYDYQRYVEDPNRIDLDNVDRSALPPFPSCDGDGVLAVARIFYLFAVGELFATGPSLSVDAQWTECSDHGFDEFVPIETRFLVPHQWWGHYTVELVWVASWR